MSELQRVLAELDDFELPSGHRYPLAEDAARVIRELAADFKKHARCNPACRSYVKCGCGLAAAKEKWRLE